MRGVGGVCKGCVGGVCEGVGGVCEGVGVYVRGVLGVYVRVWRSVCVRGVGGV